MDAFAEKLVRDGIIRSCLAKHSTRRLKVVGGELLIRSGKV
jgi:hypothetical protein